MVLCSVYVGDHRRQHSPASDLEDESGLEGVECQLSRGVPEPPVAQQDSLQKSVHKLKLARKKAGSWLQVDIALLRGKRSRGEAKPQQKVRREPSIEPSPNSDIRYLSSSRQRMIKKGQLNRKREQLKRQQVQKALCTKGVSAAFQEDNIQKVVYQARPAGRLLEESVAAEGVLQTTSSSNQAVDPGDQSASAPRTQQP